MNAGINPPGGAPQYTQLGQGGYKNVGNSRSRQQQLRAMVYQLAMQLGINPLHFGPGEREMLERMANAMVPLDKLPDQTGPGPASTTSAPNYGAYEPNWVEQIGINRREGIVKKSEGIQGGGGSGFGGFGAMSPLQRTPDGGPPKSPGGPSSDKITATPSGPPMSPDELAGLVDSYKQANAGRGIFRPGAPPTTTPPTTAPSGGAATGAGLGMGNYTAASLAEMLQELLGGGFRGGWGRGQRA